MNFTGGPKQIKYTDGTPSREVEMVEELKHNEKPALIELRERLMNILELVNTIEEEIKKL